MHLQDDEVDKNKQQVFTTTSSAIGEINTARGRERERNIPFRILEGVDDKGRQTRV